MTERAREREGLSEEKKEKKKEIFSFFFCTDALHSELIGASFGCGLSFRATVLDWLRLTARGGGLSFVPFAVGPSITEAAAAFFCRARAGSRGECLIGLRKVSFGFHNFRAYLIDVLNVENSWAWRASSECEAEFLEF